MRLLIFFTFIFILNSCHKVPTTGYYFPKYSYSKNYVGKCFLYVDSEKNRFQFYNGYEGVRISCSGNIKKLTAAMFSIKSDTNLMELPLNIRLDSTGQGNIILISKNCDFECYKNVSFYLRINDSINIPLSDKKIDTLAQSRDIKTIQIEMHTLWDYRGLNSYFKSIEYKVTSDDRGLLVDIFLTKNLLSYESIVNDTIKYLGRGKIFRESDSTMFYKDSYFRRKAWANWKK